MIFLQVIELALLPKNQHQDHESSGQERILKQSEVKQKMLVIVIYRWTTVLIRIFRFSRTRSISTLSTSKTTRPANDVETKYKAQFENKSLTRRPLTAPDKSTTTRKWLKSQRKSCSWSFDTKPENPKEPVLRGRRKSKCGPESLVVLIEAAGVINHENPDMKD